MPRADLKKASHKKKRPPALLLRPIRVPSLPLSLPQPPKPETKPTDNPRTKMLHYILSQFPQIPTDLSPENTIKANILWKTLTLVAMESTAALNSLNLKTRTEEDQDPGFEKEKEKKRDFDRIISGIYKIVSEKQQAMGLSALKEGKCDGCKKESVKLGDLDKCPDCFYTVCVVCIFHEKKGTCYCSRSNFGALYCCQRPAAHQYSKLTLERYHSDHHPDWGAMGWSGGKSAFEEKMRKCENCQRMNYCLKRKGFGEVAVAVAKKEEGAFAEGDAVY